MSYPRRVPRHHRNVTRCEHRFLGWAVCLKRQGKIHLRYFRDERNRTTSLSRALAWRDQMIAVLPPPRKIKRRYVRNKTGVIGVSRCVDRTRGGTLVPRYYASWIDERGRRHKHSFSVAKYGEAKARAMAIRLRRKVIAEMLRPRKDGGLTANLLGRPVGRRR